MHSFSPRTLTHYIYSQLALRLQSPIRFFVDPIQDPTAFENLTLPLWSCTSYVDSGFPKKAAGLIQNSTAHIWQHIFKAAQSPFYAVIEKGRKGLPEVI